MNIACRILLISFGALASGACFGAGTSPADRFAAALLSCQAHYAHRYAKATQATASEIADGAAASCRSDMDAYVAHTAELATKAGKLPPFDAPYRQQLAERLARYAHDYTIDAVIRESANEALVQP